MIKIYFNMASCHRVGRQTFKQSRIKIRLAPFVAELRAATWNQDGVRQIPRQLTAGTYCSNVRSLVKNCVNVAASSIK